jgi:hypothetical protein
MAIHLKMAICESEEAPPVGLSTRLVFLVLEPTTDWLTASRSTWLSYGGTLRRLCFFQLGRDYLSLA